MKKIFRGTFLLLLVLNATFSFSQKDSVSNDTTRTVNINLKLNELISEDAEDQAKSDSVLQLINDTDNLIKFTNHWKTKKGDDTSWAAVDFDDSDWQEVNKDTAVHNKDVEDAYDDNDWDEDNKDSLTTKLNKEIAEVESAGVAWYRMHFKVDADLVNVPLAFYFHQFGSAADVYLDGKFLKSYGKVGKDKESEIAEFSINPKPFAFVFSDRKEHVLAIRYSNFHRAEAKGIGISLGKNFRVSVKNLNEEIEDVADPSKYFPFIFFAAIFLTLGVVHFIMFAYNTQKKSNFSYSIYCFVIFIITYYIYYILTATDYNSITVLSRMVMYLSAVVVVPLVSMLHRIFYGRRLRIFWAITAIFAVSLFLFFTHRLKSASMMVVILFLISTIEIIRVIIKAIVKKKDGAWIFAFVILLAPIAGIISASLPDEFVISGIKIPNNTGIIVLSSFILGLPFSMTLYLARDFALMGKQLKKQLKEITGLSEKTIQQEKEKKQILENQKSELELKVVERTQEVWQQKEVIELKNKEITESLVYAKRIQSAILPDIKLIYKTLEQSFVLYLPKDIVSGDFYGFAQKNNRVIIAAADCTGHGVSGAFMSMIGSALLNQIINEKNITAPSRILDALNEGIIDSLKQKESESDDGMDIALCAFDLAKQTVQFSGANRPLWLVRNNELQIFRPDKFPIGGLQVEHAEKFTAHEIELQKNDTLYIFSDGFADQFGGERGKKLMTKKFKEALLSIQQLNMSEQQKYLKTLFETWKGNNEQVDDVLVIGIRI